MPWVRKLRVVYDTPDYKFGLRFSPDGKWVAYTSNLSGEYEVYMAPFPSFTGRRQVSERGGLYPVWRKDGKELFFPTREGIVMAAEIKTGSKPEVVTRKALFKINVTGFGQFAVSADGQRFLVNELVAPSAMGQLTVVLNWAAGLKQ